MSNRRPQESCLPWAWLIFDVRQKKQSYVKQSISLVSLVVREYDEALEFFIGKLGFVLVEDSFVPAQNKRSVVVAPRGGGDCRLLLARASSDEQKARVGGQTGGRVFLFLTTDDFWRDFESYKSKGIEFVRPPKEENYGTVAVFKDLYGNLWDLIQPRAQKANKTPNKAPEPTPTSVTPPANSR